MKEVEDLKKARKQADRGTKALRNELDQVKGKLNNLWASQEADIEHCRLVTKYEVEKASQGEIAKLANQVSLLEDQVRRQQDENVAQQQRIEEFRSITSYVPPSKAAQTTIKQSETVSIGNYAE